MNWFPPNLGCGGFSSCCTDMWYSKRRNAKKGFCDVITVIKPTFYLHGYIHLHWLYLKFKMTCPTCLQICIFILTYLYFILTDLHIYTCKFAYSYLLIWHLHIQILKICIFILTDLHILPAAPVCFVISLWSIICSAISFTSSGLQDRDICNFIFRIKLQNLKLKKFFPHGLWWAEKLLKDKQLAFSYLAGKLSVFLKAQQFSCQTIIK